MWKWILANKEWIFSGAGLAAIAGVASLIRSMRSRRRDTEVASPSQNVKLRVFEAPRSGRYNHEFYNYFAAKLAGARTNIYLTGEGFECADDEGEGVARQFTEALRHALRRQVQVVRIQTRAGVHHRWANMLADLLREFPNTFALYALRENTVAQMSSVCVIDPEYDDGCVVEIMLSTQKLFGTQAADLAGTAIFVEGSSSLARDLCQRIRSLTSVDTALHFRSADETVAALSGREEYFAFGSNMSSEPPRVCRRAVNVS